MEKKPEKTEYQLLVDEYNDTNESLMKLKTKIDEAKLKTLLPKITEKYNNKYFKLVANGWTKYIHVTNIKSIYEVGGDVIQIVTSESGPLTNSTVIVSNANISLEELDIEKNDGIGIVITDSDSTTYNNIILDKAKELVGG